MSKSPFCQGRGCPSDGNRSVGDTYICCTRHPNERGIFGKKLDVLYLRVSAHRSSFRNCRRIHRFRLTALRNRAFLTLFAALRADTERFSYASVSRLASSAHDERPEFRCFTVTFRYQQKKPQSAINRLRKGNAAAIYFPGPSPAKYLRRTGA